MGYVQKYWTPNVGCNIRISLATGIPEYDEYVKSIYWFHRAGLRFSCYASACLMVRLAIVEDRLGRIPRLFGHR